MKQKPVFKNTTKGRIQVIQQGIPIWMNPGDVIVGERFRIYTNMGLEEVGRSGLPSSKQPLPPPVVNDPEPKKSPVKVRELKIVDHVMPMDDMKVEMVTTPPEPVLDLKKSEDQEDVDIVTLPPPEDEEPELALRLTGEGEDLKEEILSDILSGFDDESDLVVIDDSDDAPIELEEPDDYPYKCNQCERSFASQRGLKSHSRVHNEE